MATTVTVTSNYAGKEAGAIVGKAFKEADTISKGLVTVFENVNYKTILNQLIKYCHTQIEVYVRKNKV